MSGKAVSGKSRAEVRQRPPQRCQRCGKRTSSDSTWLAGTGEVCDRCAGIITASQDRTDRLDDNRQTRKSR